MSNYIREMFKDKNSLVWFGINFFSGANILLVASLLFLELPYRLMSKKEGTLNQNKL